MPSEPTLYEIDYDHPEMTERAKAWFEVAKVLGVLVEHGRLETFRPDYEAALAACYGTGVFRSEVKGIVDAALGIGGGDYGN